MALRECTDFVGRRLLIEETPSRRLARNAVFIPPGNGPHWGLFEPSGRAITESMTFTGHPSGEMHIPVGSTQCPVFPTDCPTLPSAYDYIYVGPINTHFGHFLIGSLSRLWALPPYSRSKLRIVFSSEVSLDELMQLDFFRSITVALGLGSENFLRVVSPVRFDAIDVPAAAMDELSLIHRVFAELAHAIGRQIVPGASRALPARAMYISKEKLVRGNVTVDNETALTTALQRHGVGIVFPEHLTFREQLKIWASNPSVIAFNGSSLHGSLFFPQRHVITLSHVREMWVNQCLIDMANDNRALYLCEEDGLEPIGPSETFKMVFRIRDPERMAAEIADAALG